MKEEILRIENATKKKNQNELLRGIYLQVFKGETLGVIFDNILEKQCMIDIFRGKTNFDFGKIYYNDQRLSELNTQNVLKSNIAVIEKNNSLLANLTVAENIYNTAGKFKGFYINKKKYEKKAREILKEFNIGIKTENSLKMLTTMEKVMVALIKAYVAGKNLIVLIDITSFLNNIEIEKILRLMLDLKRRGMSFIIFETYEDFVFDHTDKLLIIKNGETLGIFQSKIINRQKIYSILIDGKSPTSFDSIKLRPLQVFKNDKIVLSFKNVCTEVLKDVNFEINRGEIVKLLYMDDPSYEHIIGLLKGELKDRSGELCVNGRNLGVTGVWNAVRKGIGFIEENPIETMLFYDMSVLDNLCITMAKKAPGFWIKKRYQNSIMKNVEEVIGKHVLNTPMLNLTPVTLQKIVYCKWLLYAPDIVICLKPFSAVDIHIRHVTQQMVRLLIDRGIAVLIVTSNISEIHYLDGKILYLKDGKMINQV